VSLGAFTSCSTRVAVHRNFSFGLLHRIPPMSADRDPSLLPPELEEEEEELFVPAETTPNMGYVETPSYPHSYYSQSQHSHDHLHSDHDHSHDHGRSRQENSRAQTNGKTVHNRNDSSNPSWSGGSRSATPVRNASLVYSHIRTPTPTRGFGLTGGASPPS
jgi:hypothetical protein